MSLFVIHMNLHDMYNIFHKSEWRRRTSTIRSFVIINRPVLGVEVLLPVGKKISIWIMIFANVIPRIFPPFQANKNTGSRQENPTDVEDDA